ncbi:MAG: MFS transporter [Chloroflexota bacterium]
MLNKLFRQNAIPPEYRSNFLHLYLDIGWFGVLSGSTINFLNVYATRLGATGYQIGLVGAMPAVVTLCLAIPAARWLAKQKIDRAMFWTSVYYRLGFLGLIFLPWLFSNLVQINAIIAVTFLMAIPLTPLGVGFNALFAESVPSEYRAHVAGIRNVTLSVTFMATSLLSGYLLDHIKFPVGYQIVFAIGYLGAAMSSLHLYFIKPLVKEKAPLLSQPLPASTTQADSPRSLANILRLDIWKTPYRAILLALFGFHLAQYLAIPIFPIFNVRELKLNDDQLGISTALFYLTVFLGSTQLRNVVHRLGNKRTTGWGVAAMSTYPIIIAFSTNVAIFYFASIVGGFAWSLVGGSYANYMLEHIPADDRPPHLAWYNIILNVAILIGSLAGPAIAAQIGLFQALILFGIMRFVAGISILKWG